jgi:hypothetical protein
MMKKTWITLCLLLINVHFEAFAKDLNAGPWKFVLKSTYADIPFIIKFKYKNKKLVGVLQNGTEKITLDEIKYSDNTLSIPLQSYELSLELTQQDENSLSGYLIRHNKNPVVKTPIIGLFGTKERFDVASQKAPTINLTGKWALEMVDENITKNVKKSVQMMNPDIKNTNNQLYGDLWQNFELDQSNRVFFSTPNSRVEPGDQTALGQYLYNNLKYSAKESTPEGAIARVQDSYRYTLY